MDNVEVTWGKSPRGPLFIRIVVETELDGKPFHYIEDVASSSVFMALDRDTALAEQKAKVLHNFAVQVARYRETQKTHG